MQACLRSALSLRSLSAGAHFTSCAAFQRSKLSPLVWMMSIWTLQCSGVAELCTIDQAGSFRSVDSRRFGFTHGWGLISLAVDKRRTLILQLCHDKFNEQFGQLHIFHPTNQPFSSYPLRKFSQVQYNWLQGVHSWYSWTSIVILTFHCRIQPGYIIRLKFAKNVLYLYGTRTRHYCLS